MNNLLTKATFVIQQRTAEQRLFSLRSLLASARCCLHARASIIIQELFKNYSRIVQELFNNYSRIMATCLFNFAIILPSSLASVSDKLRCAPVDDATRFSVQTSVSSSSIFRSQIAVMLVNCIGRRRVAAVSMLTRANLCRAIYFKSASVRGCCCSTSMQSIFVSAHLPVSSDYTSFKFQSCRQQWGGQ